MSGAGDKRVRLLRSEEPFDLIDCDDLDTIHAEQMKDPEYVVRYELAEARAEIARHHLDFERIRDVLTEYEEKGGMSAWCWEPVKKIRGIVG